MKLLEYLKKHSLTQKKFAEKVGVTQAHITNIISGKKRPSIQLTKRIEMETNRKVGLDDFLHIETSYKQKRKKKTENT